ncbi:hypothetical protein AVEN_50080-1 [Araneus ventricosus]|uniref:Uncharacterized protein n=1 Tax=Araneus ventricosus TaxID=182803 RepID=A0A4Y1ZS52_ARAVE|nr:hypothetical protein AVEN_50080-1 [Araneus ventricosus]
MDPLSLFPQMADDSKDFVFQQDGAPPHWKIHIRLCGNDELPHRWIGRTNELAFFPCPPSPLPCDFFLWKNIKGLVFIPPLPKSTLEDLKNGSTFCNGEN